MDLKGKNALITGAGKGIGRALALALAKEGVRVGLVSRSVADLEQLASTISTQFQTKTSYAPADVSKRDEALAAYNHIKQDLGPLDILINNAGIASFGTVTQMPPEEWDRIIQVNLYGTYHMTYVALPDMIDRNSGSILNIASTAGERGFATGSAYCASKFAVLGFTESVLQEVRKNNIRVTALTPSTVNTELAANAGLKIGEEHRMLQPEDVAELALATLQLPERVFVKTAGIWTTNPQ
ncbi:3-ketoacyl-ACP reductase [Brevibacillus choshinensis]|uniref:3-ketoacyl-ACP reductase n=1 Tax=Brevibacillus choshinensis TaxID=54911 RepID=A0ABR5N195_BRECH|nr:3-ketoacyl-ACP reductase [Brevibacillus choshinensis]KQL44269.1 3-ketoacyl-ACP reductase [Brevibacillus choshinensis]